MELSEQFRVIYNRRCAGVDDIFDGVPLLADDEVRCTLEGLDSNSCGGKPNKSKPYEQGSIPGGLLSSM